MRKVSIKAAVHIAIFAILGALVMVLWNHILPNVCGCSQLNYWQATGLLLLSRILSGRGSTIKTKARKWSVGSEIHNRVKGMSHEEKMEYIKSYMKDHQD